MIPHARYPYVIRLMLTLFNNGQLSKVTAIDLEENYGYVGRICYDNGAVRFFKGSNLNVNRHGAAAIALDKGYTKYFLQQFGYHTPQGRTFVTDHFFQQSKAWLLRAEVPLLRTQQVAPYVQDALGYPCFVKPNEGAQGQGVYKCDDARQLAAAITQLSAQRHEVLLVEEAVQNLPEYRVLVYDGRVVCCYRRVPLLIVGDGQRSIQQLLETKQADFDARQRRTVIDVHDPRIQAKLSAKSYTLTSVLAQDERLALLDNANLSTGGDVDDYSEDIHPFWQQFAIDLTRKMGLTLCGIDLCCADIKTPDSDYSILELNATPTVSAYATSSEAARKRIEAFYAAIINTPPATA